MGYLIGLLIALGYGFGAWKFWQGFNRTNFEQSFGNRAIFSLFWPALFIVNKSYRKNFAKALKGSRY
jgi:hypothetical protein